MPEEEDIIDPAFESLLEGAEVEDVLSLGELSPTVDAMANYLLSESPDVPLPAGAKERMLDAVAQLDQESDPRLIDYTPADSPVSGGSKWKVILPWSLAACLAVAFTIVLFEMNSLRGVVAEQKSENDALVAKLLGGAEVTVLGSKIGEDAGAFALWDGESQEVMLKCSGLPPLDPAINDYQLWIVDPQYNVPVDGGIFQVRADGSILHEFKAPLQVEKVAAFAITKEVKGGVEVSAGPHLLVGATE